MKEPIIGSIGKTNFSITVEELKIGDNGTIKGIQVSLDEFDLKWFIHAHDGMWRNSFIHTPYNIKDKLPPNLSSVDSPQPLWMSHDKRRNKDIGRALKYCGLTTKDGAIAIDVILKCITQHSLMSEIDLVICDDPYLCEHMAMDADIDYDNPLWFMIDKKFSAKAVAIRTIELFKEQMHTIKTIKENKEILIFHEGVYLNGEDEVEIMIRNLLGHRATIHYVKEVKDEIRTRTLILLASFNPDNFINLQNGVYMVHEKTFAHIDEGIYEKPNMFFRYKLPIYYDADATCPQIQKFFEWAQPDKTQREQVYEEISYGFCPDHRIQKFFLWYGSGKNGKGTAAMILRALIGAQNISGHNIENLETRNSNTYAQADVVTKKWNICGDLPNVKVPFDFLKAATGNDIVAVREIREKPYNVINACKFLFMMNSVPVFADVSDGATRRIILTIWGMQIDDKDIDPYLEEKLTTQQEISGFFNLLMNSYDNLMERKFFIYNPSIEETENILSEVRGEDIDLFIAERCHTGKDLKYSRKVLYDEYCRWHSSRASTAKPKGIFNSFIRDKGYKTVKIGSEVVWTGLRFIDDDEYNAQRAKFKETMDEM